jgi:predicted DNA-binding transcriptional regulator AlpA
MADKPRAEPPAQYGSAADVCRMLAISRSTLRKRVKAGHLPAPIPSPTGARALRWDLRRIADLMQEAARQEPPSHGPGPLP